MKKIQVRSTQPKQLSPKQATQLTDQLYDVHCQIFSGVSKKEFIQYVLFPEALYTRIYLYENQDSTIVGYLAIHCFERLVEGKKTLIMRGENGVLPAYRCHWTNTITMMKEGLRLKTRYPFRSCYYLGCFVYPVIYSIFARYMHEFYPNPNYATPPAIEQQMLAIADSFHLPQVDEANALVRQVGWVTKDTAACVNRLQRSKRLSIQFYLHQNPNYVDGNGLLTLSPVSYKNVLLSIANVLKFKLGRKFKLSNLLKLPQARPASVLKQVRALAS